MSSKNQEYFFLWGIVSLIVLSIFSHIAYGNELKKLTLISTKISRVYSDSNWLQPIVLNGTNQNMDNGIELVGNVTYVVDGDTLDINGIRVRLSLVDTPERGQPGFKEAKEFVSTLCLGKKAELNVDDGQRRGDRYGREIGVVYCDGLDINEKLMDNKLASILTEYCDISEFANEGWATASCNVHQ
ncbi:MAG TPA: thermonuclease family protein [Nitrososphaeraceae archaeon]|jgi:micrococcal nuclease